MRQEQRSTAPVAAGFMLLGLVALIILLLGLHLWRDYKSEVERAEIRTANAAHTTAVYVRWLFEASNQALRRVEALVSEGRSIASIAGVGDLADTVHFLPRETVLWVVDENGSGVVSTEPSALSVNIGDRDYFQALRDGAPWSISSLLTDRVTGKRGFVISLRINRGGRFGGAIAVIVPASIMSDFWQSLDLGPDSSVSLVRDDGWLIARHPVPNQGIDLSRRPLFTELLPKAPSGIYRSPVSPADGVSRMVGYHRVADLPLVAISGISVDAQLAPFWRRSLITLGLAAPLLSALVIVSLALTRLLNRDQRNQERLAQALDRNELLLRDIHHRVKNNLQVVMSLVQLEPLPAETRAGMLRRLDAIASVHEHIYSSSDIGSIDLPDYLRTIIEGLEKVYSGNARIMVDAAPVSVDAELAGPLGLIASEIISNAMKHAFGDRTDGEIRVSLTSLDDDRLVLRIADNGIGRKEGQKAGMGTKLLEGLSRQIGGTYSFADEGGTAFELVFRPLTKKA